MTNIAIRIDTEEAIRAYGRAPEVMRRHVAEGVEQGATLIARGARRNASQRDFHGTLTASIRPEPVPEPLPADVIAWQARTGTHYARYVEEGIRPNQPRRPGISNGLMEWIKAKLRPADERAAERLAFVVGSAIQRRGLRARPYMRPAAEQSEPGVRAVLKGAVARGVQEVFGAG